MEGWQAWRSRVGLGVKLKSPSTHGEGRCRAERRWSERKEARAVWPVQGQYVLTSVRVCPAQATRRVWSRPEGEEEGSEMVKVGEGRTRMRMPLFSRGRDVLLDQKERYGGAPTEVVARRSHRSMSAEEWVRPWVSGRPAHVSWTQMMSKSAACQRWTRLVTV